MLDEKKYVAKDYQGSNQFLWPNYFNAYKLINADERELTKLKLNSYLSYTMFYVGPFVITSIFSVLLYPRAVYLVKKIFKFKSFYSINLGVVPILLFFNIRVFSFTQTYIGFKIIEKAYLESVKDLDYQVIRDSEYHGKYYKILKGKLLQL